jgi:hypothetical protein
MNDGFEFLHPHGSLVKIYKLKKQLVQYIVFSFRSIILVLCKSVLSLSLISFSFTHDIPDCLWLWAVENSDYNTAGYGSSDYDPTVYILNLNFIFIYN